MAATNSQQPADSADRLVALTEASRRLGLEVSWLRRLAARGDFPAHRVGSTWVIASRDLDAYLADRQRRGGEHTQSTRPATTAPVHTYTGRNHQIGLFNTQGACLVNAPTPTPVHPGGAESIAITVSDCSARALPNATTTTTTTAPSGCPAAPAIATYVDNLTSGQSAAHTAAITAPTCAGDYNFVSTTTVGSTVVATAADTYHVAGVGDGFIFTTSSLPGYIAAGSDGNLWVTFGSTLARVTPSGIVSTFSSAIQGYAQQLVTGSDGDLYVNASATGQSDIANLQPASYGPAFKWEVPVTGTSINDLAPGPDGNVWFAGHPSVNPGGTLGFVTPAGKVKLFHLPLADGVPQAITPGSDGALWFLLDSGQIGRISTTGTVTLFTPPTPTSFGGSNTATLGADGNVWFAGSDSNGNDIVGHISPAGDVREYATLQPRAEITGNHRRRRRQRVVQPAGAALVRIRQRGGSRDPERRARRFRRQLHRHQ